VPGSVSPVSIDVSVVASNVETVASLRQYLTGAGVSSQPALALHDPIGALANAVVIFPDDFELAAVVAWLQAIRQTRPRLLIVLVTGTPQHFRAAVSPDGTSLPPVVLPKPAFGWTILDAIRAEREP
jgi:hypothetical protein